MLAPVTAAESRADRVRLPLAFDAAALAAEVAALGLGDFVYYDVVPLRSPAHVVDPSRPPPPPAEDFRPPPSRAAIAASYFLRSAISSLRRALSCCKTGSAAIRRLL